MPFQINIRCINHRYSLKTTKSNKATQKIRKRKLKMKRITVMASK